MRAWPGRSAGVPPRWRANRAFRRRSFAAIADDGALSGGLEHCLPLRTTAAGCAVSHCTKVLRQPPWSRKGAVWRIRVRARWRHVRVRHGAAGLALSKAQGAKPAAKCTATSSSSPLPASPGVPQPGTTPWQVAATSTTLLASCGDGRGTVAVRLPLLAGRTGPP